MHREPTNSTDEFLIYAIVAAQEEALLELYHRYKRLVFSLAKRILRTAEDAEEVTQDVFVKIWNKAPEYTPQKGSVSTWVLTITHHNAIDALRKRNSRASLPVFEDELERIADTRDSRDVLEQTVIQKAMQQLEPQEQQCIELAYFEGLSHSQLASKLELPLGSVKTRIRTGLQKLRDSLGDW